MKRGGRSVWKRRYQERITLRWLIVPQGIIVVLEVWTYILRDVNLFELTLIHIHTIDSLKTPVSATKNPSIQMVVQGSPSDYPNTITYWYTPGLTIREWRQAPVVEHTTLLGHRTLGHRTQMIRAGSNLKAPSYGLAFTAQNTTLGVTREKKLILLSICTTHEPQLCPAWLDICKGE